MPRSLCSLAVLLIYELKSINFFFLADSFNSGFEIRKSCILSKLNQLLVIELICIFKKSYDAGSKTNIALPSKLLV